MTKRDLIDGHPFFDGDIWYWVGFSGEKCSKGDLTDREIDDIKFTYINKKQVAESSRQRILQLNQIAVGTESAEDYLSAPDKSRYLIYGTVLNTLESLWRPFIIS